VSEIKASFKKVDTLEDFMRRQERLLKQNEFYKRLIVIPVVVILVSVSVIAFNLTVYRQQDAADLQKNTDVDVRCNVTYAEKLNLNTATVEILDSLPGIGPQKAEAIVELRNRMGGFRSVEDILNVDGIGEKILAEIQNMLYIQTE